MLHSQKQDLPDAARVLAGFSAPAPPSCPVALAGLQGVVQGLGAGFKFMHLPGWCSSLSSLLAHPPGAGARAGAWDWP